MSNIIIPNFGESVNSATISTWHFSDGDEIKVGDILVTLETDKVASELEAEESGILQITVPEGEDVSIGSIIGHIKTNGDNSNTTMETVSGVENKIPPSAISTAATVEPVRQAAASSAQQDSPVQIQMEFSQKTATSKKISAPSETDRYTRTRMSKMRRTIAAKLVEAQHQAAILTTFNECDMSAIMELRRQFKEKAPADGSAKLGFMSFFMKAVVHALKEVPQINARIDGEDLIQNNYYDLSIAIGSDNGLVVPAIRDCDQKGHLQLEKELVDLAGKAKEGKLQLSDLQGGVFTISNGGTYGSMLSTPILNPPQSAILGMHAIMQRPVAIDGKIEIRPMMYLALSYDHRIIDGKQAVTFLIKVKESLENPLLEL